MTILDILNQYSDLELVAGVLVIGLILYWFIEEIPWSNINVGLSTSAGLENAHGVLFLNGTKKVMIVPFRVDRPRRLIHPTPMTLSEIFTQVRKMQLDAIAMEIHYGANRAVYYPNRFNPVLLHPS